MKISMNLSIFKREEDHLSEILITLNVILKNIQMKWKIK